MNTCSVTKRGPWWTAKHFAIIHAPLHAWIHTNRRARAHTPHTHTQAPANTRNHSHERSLSVIKAHNVELINQRAGRWLLAVPEWTTRCCLDWNPSLWRARPAVNHEGNAPRDQTPQKKKKKKKQKKKEQQPQGWTQGARPVVGGSTVGLKTYRSDSLNLIFPLISLTHFLFSPPSLPS